jgi:hypothetical protein
VFLAVFFFPAFRPAGNLVFLPRLAVFGATFFATALAFFATVAAAFLGAFFFATF